MPRNEVPAKNPALLTDPSLFRRIREALLVLPKFEDACTYIGISKSAGNYWRQWGREAAARKEAGEQLTKADEAYIRWNETIIDARVQFKRELHGIVLDYAKGIRALDADGRPTRHWARKPKAEVLLRLLAIHFPDEYATRTKTEITGQLTVEDFLKHSRAATQDIDDSVPAEPEGDAPDSGDTEQ